MAGPWPPSGISPRCRIHGVSSLPSAGTMAASRRDAMLQWRLESSARPTRFSRSWISTKDRGKVPRAPIAVLIGAKATSPRRKPGHRVETAVATFSPTTSADRRSWQQASALRELGKRTRRHRFVLDQSNALKVAHTSRDHHSFGLTRFARPDRSSNQSASRRRRESATRSHSRLTQRR